jgi:hypothetical protein
MELPIFRELESAWFQTAPPPAPGAPQPPAPGAPQPLAAQAGQAAPTTSPAPAVQDDDPAATAVTTQRYSTADPARPPTVPQQGGSAAADRLADTATTIGDPSSSGEAAPSRGTGSPAGGWRTAADDGWQAARAAAEAAVETTTTTGLPRRTPMAQLVPGGVERADNSVQRRSPEAVRGLLSAYHRGVQRGRTKENPTSPEETPGGPQSSQAGKEHEA